MQCIIHHPKSLPIFMANDIIVPVNKESFIQVDSVYNTADSTVRELNMDSRECIFDNERKLQFFRFYT